MFIIMMEVLLRNDIEMGSMQSIVNKMSVLES